MKKKEEAKEESKVLNAKFVSERIIAENSDEVRTLYDSSRFGELKDNRIQYSNVEALYLMEKDKLKVLDGKKELEFESFVKKVKKNEPNFLIRYYVYRDLRSRGYIVKTALKFGADFRVYDRGIKPGDDHAKWIVYPVSEGGMFSWFDFSAKNRVAHSTRKNLLIAVVDDENDCTYYEISWTRP